MNKKIFKAQKTRFATFSLAGEFCNCSVSFDNDAPVYSMLPQCSSAL